MRETKQTKRARRSHHNVAPFGMFEQKARVKKFRMDMRKKKGEKAE